MAEARGGEVDIRVTYRTNPLVVNDGFNRLFAAAWPAHAARDFAAVHQHSLAFVCAFHGAQVVGYVNLAWDGGMHAFLLDTTVHPHYRRRGIGRALVLRAASVARDAGLAWLHVDYEPELARFYRACGFLHTEAGLMRLR